MENKSVFIKRDLSSGQLSVLCEVKQARGNNYQVSLSGFVSNWLRICDFQSKKELRTGVVYRTQFWNSKRSPIIDQLVILVIVPKVVIIRK